MRVSGRRVRHRHVVAVPQRRNLLLMGRPGLDPGTFGSDRARPSASVTIHLTWSDPLGNPPTSAEILSNSDLGLRQSLQDSGSRAVGTIRFQNVDGDQFDLLVEIWGALMGTSIFDAIPSHQDRQSPMLLRFTGSPRSL
jgi:hypothetical protein